MNSRVSAKRIHAKAGVIGHGHRKAGLIERRLRLDQRVVVEGLTVLVWVFKAAKLAKGHKTDPLERRRLTHDRLNLGELVSVASCYNNGGLGVERCDVYGCHAVSLFLGSWLYSIAAPCGEPVLPAPGMRTEDKHCRDPADRALQM